MKYVKFLFMLLSLMSMNVYAAGISNFDKIVFFGDSLTDDGNLYRIDLHTVPKSPPYYEGRFSNGPTWAEDVAKYFSENGNMDAENYAVGGETATHQTSDVALNFDLDMSLAEYYVKNALKDKSNTLFVFLIGANDYFKGDISDPEKITADTVAKIKSSVEDLIGHGGQYFLVINLPDAGKTPSVVAAGKSEAITQLFKLHNAKLQDAVNTIQSDNSKVVIHLFDAFALDNDVIANPDAYNKKYDLHIANVSAACWLGGNQLKVDAMIKQLSKDAVTNKNVTFTPLANEIIRNKDLSTAFMVGERYAAGEEPCADPDSYIFWDGMHPSRVAHQIMGSEVVSYINNNYQ